ncbi:MAG: MFS transporter [Bacteroidetes bacterium]|nr:MFS transporter [Bacteroidota bacterium]MCL6102936.1 MFS transporter [Bacteroidota bacterium]
MTPTTVLKKFPSNFWYANAMELFERWAWYGFYMLFALYLTGSTDQGGLGFSQTQKGLMMGIGTAILYFLPIITGAIADRIGYRKTLFIAYSLYTVAFLMMPLFHTYAAVFVFYLFLAIGAALFKPIISATVAKTTNKETSSIGFGIFYMMVNIGAFVGPFVTSFFRKYSWDYVFYASAAVIAFNFVLLILLFKEPAREKGGQHELSFLNELKKLFRNIYEALSDWRFFLFLLIIAGFWTMFNQLYLSLPVFIEQWGNTSIVYNFLHSTWPWLAGKIGTAEGTIPAELMVNVDAGFIILFQIIVSAVAMRYKPLKVMTTGILIASIAMGLCFSTQNGLFMVVFLMLFSIGEMSSSPKITEYIGRIAPPNKTALYMGCSFIPVAIGFLFAGFVSGNVYQATSDKISLAQREMAAQNFQLPAIGEHFSQNDYLHTAAQKMGLSNGQFTQFLWDKYHPSSIWMVISGIGIAAVIALFLYDRFVIKNKNVQD